MNALEQRAKDLSDMILEADKPKHLEHVCRAAKQVLANWDEFGPDGGLDEYMEGLRKALRDVP